MQLFCVPFGLCWMCAGWQCARFGAAWPAFAWQQRQQSRSHSPELLRGPGRHCVPLSRLLLVPCGCCHGVGAVGTSYCSTCLPATRGDWAAVEQCCSCCAWREVHPGPTACCLPYPWTWSLQPPRAGGTCTTKPQRNEQVCCVSAAARQAVLCE